MEKKANAVVLRAADYGENDKILSLFTLEEGVIVAGIKGVKKAGAKLRFAAQPLSFNEYVFSSKGGRNTVVGATGLDSFYDLRTDIFRFYAAATAGEFCLDFLPEGIVSPAVFFGLVELLKQLCYGTGDAGTLLCKFLYDALSSAGDRADFSGCVRCGCPEISGKVLFDFERGACVCVECSAEGDVGMSESTYRFLHSVAQGTPYEDLPQIASDTIRRALKFLAYFIEYKTDVKLKSIQELLSMYAQKV